METRGSKSVRGHINVCERERERERKKESFDWDLVTS